jgi:serine/threonine protein kinase
MKAQIKIIDFGFACKIAKDSLTYTAIGNPINMDPLILKKLNTPGRKARQLGYDQKADIWSLGAICYEMLIGRAAFDAEDMNDLVNKVEAGKYKVPTSLSKEVISFLNGMLQYQPTQRLTIEQLYNHPFLENNIQNFHSIDLRQVSNKLDKNKKEIIIDVKKNQSIWAIFNQEDENKLNNIPGQLVPIPEVNERKNERKKSQENHLNNKIEDDGYPIRTTNTYQVKQKMGINNYNPFLNNNINNYNNYNRPYGPYLAIQGIPGNQMYQIPMPKMQMQQLGTGANQTISAAPTTESYTFSGGNISGIK